MSTFISNRFKCPNESLQIRIAVIQKDQVSVPSGEQLMHLHKLWNGLEGQQQKKGIEKKHSIALDLDI